MSTLNDKLTRYSFHDMLPYCWNLRDALSDKNDVGFVGLFGGFVGLFGNVSTLAKYMDAKTIGYDIMMGFVI